MSGVDSMDVDSPGRKADEVSEIAVKGEARRRKVDTKAELVSEDAPVGTITSTHNLDSKLEARDKANESLKAALEKLQKVAFLISFVAMACFSHCRMNLLQSLSVEPMHMKPPKTRTAVPARLTGVLPQTDQTNLVPRDLAAARGVPVTENEGAGTAKMD